MFDCHAHLVDAAFDADLDRVLATARAQERVLGIVCVATDATDAKRVLQLSERYSGFVLPALGLHPVNVRAARGLCPLVRVRPRVRLTRYAARLRAAEQGRRGW
jgi:TatD DNase family protein